MLARCFRRARQIALRQKCKRILIIEDDAMTRWLLAEILRGDGYVPIEAKNGVEGMQLYHSEQPDVIVTDIMMPDKEGLETIMEIRAEDASVPIIAMSGKDVQNLSFLVIARKFGATNVLAKPFLPRDILALLHSIAPAPSQEFMPPQNELQQEQQ